jgi:hypothetical protein
MKTEPWILLDTETTGFAAPVFVVEIAAQRMRGWETQGHPLRNLMNQNWSCKCGRSKYLCFWPVRIGRRNCLGITP